MTRILVVDDVITDQRLAGGLLARHGEYEVLYAANGREALEQFERHRPELVLTDIQMPELDGLQLVVALKERSPRTPVILMTARGSEETAREALAIGAASYIPKRSLPQELLEIVERVLVQANVIVGERRLWDHLAEVSYVLENDQRLISALVSQVRRIISDRGWFDESASLRISGAIDEALQNAYFHGNLEVDSKLREQPDNAFHKLADERRVREPYCQRRIHFRMRVDAETVRFTIMDDGPGFDVSAIPDPTEPEFFERPHGRGVFLMRSFMDEVDFNAKGNAVTMVKSLVPVEGADEDDD